MISFNIGDNFYREFTTHRASGLNVDADSTPTATASKNGVDDAWSLTVTDAGVGFYRISGVISASFAVGDVISIRVAATIESTAVTAVIYQFVVSVNAITIDNKIGLISSALIVIRSPVDQSGNLTLIQGSAYSIAVGNQIEFSVDNTFELSNDHAGVVTLEMTNQTDNHGDELPSFTATNILNAGSADQTVQFEFTSAETSSLALSEAEALNYPNRNEFKAYKYSLVYDNGAGNCFVIQNGYVHVIDSQGSC